MPLFATSVLLQKEDADETTTTSHTLHWCVADTHEAAISEAIQSAKKLKPTLAVVDVICANTASGASRRVAFSENETSVAY